VFPLGADVRAKTLQVATSDPTNVDALNDIAFKTGMKTSVSVATASAIDRAVRRLYYGEQTGPMPTASPQRFGVPEPMFDAVEISGLKPRPSIPSDPMVEIDAAARDAEIARLKERIAALEKQSDKQVRALRALVDVLVQAGLVSRDEYLAKANRE
jgi:type IV pilus assembly protein PilB